ncbi:hypothetical protein V6N11_024618 [Hibiscus sabdariffa]|uniref:Uncharacterized protein n=1 Tax=Hibiscus sabdariffa TaxID=183260 RepID=A0ABR2QMN3_9ROSI
MGNSDMPHHTRTEPATDLLFLEPPSAEVVQVNSRVSGTGALNAPLNEINGGRPPDPARSVMVPSQLERLANPVNEEDQQVVKCSRRESDEVMDIGVEEIIVVPKNGLRDGVVNDGNGEKGEIQQGGNWKQFCSASR